MNYSPEQQKLLIEALINDPELYVRCQHILRPNYFHKMYQKSIKFILEFSEKYHSVPSTEQIFSESSVTFDKMEKISQEHQRYFLDEIEAFCKHSALEQAILKGADLLEKGQYGSIEKIVKEALLVGLHKDMGVDYFNDPKERLNKLRNSNGAISSGWASLDQKLYNLNRGELMIFAAPSNGGKSMTMQNFMLNMAFQTLNTIYITFEMSAELCAMRVDTMVTGIPTKEIFKKLDDVELAVKMTGKRCGRMFFKDMPHASNTNDIRSYLREFQIQNGFMPDVILVDYLDLMSANDKRVNPSDLFIKDKFVSEELRAMAKEFNLLCISASQFNRSGSDAMEFNQTMIAGGKSKIDTCDNAIGIYLTPKMKERGEIEFQLMKTRNSNGVGQKIILAYDENSMRITDLTEANTSSSNSNKPSSVLDRIGRKNTSQQPSSETATNNEIKTPTQPAEKRAESINNLINKIRKD